MQVHKSEFRSVMTCARTVYRSEGLSAFYVSYPTTLAISIPYNAIQFTVYEQVKRFMNPTREYSPTSHIVAGAVSGAVAAAATTPLDVAKTILQTRGTHKDADIRNVRGMADAFRVIWRRDGLKYVANILEDGAYLRHGKDDLVSPCQSLVVADDSLHSRGAPTT